MKLSDHLEKLKYFYEVARLGSLKKVSETSHISQPSLSKSIKLLEDEIGSPLFIRLPRGMQLTKEGKILQKYCQKLFVIIDDMEQELTYPDNPLAGSIKIGTYESIGIYFWPLFLQSFLNKYKDLDLELSTGRSSDIQNDLESGHIDLALIVNPETSLNTTMHVFAKDSFKLFQSTKANKVFKNLESAPLIVMPSALSKTESLEGILAKNGLSNRKTYTTSSLESVKELTINGIGIGLLPSLVAKSSIESGLIEEINLKAFPKKGINHHTIGILHHNYRKDSKLIKEMIKSIKEFKL